MPAPIRQVLTSSLMAVILPGKCRVYTLCSQTRHHKHTATSHLRKSNKENDKSKKRLSLKISSRGFASGVLADGRSIRPTRVTITRAVQLGFDMKVGRSGFCSEVLEYASNVFYEHDLDDILMVWLV